MTAWPPEELERIGRADDLRIAVKRADGTLRRWVPIWVVDVGGQAYVRTWYRRDDGWFGHVLDSRRARIRAPGSRSMSPLRTSAQARPRCARTLMPPTAPSTDATAERLSTGW
jgi:hypothetical protein